MKKLFFELLKVATGKLECVERGPSPEEWQTLYEWSKQQQVVGITYRGVERLFEYGLRAPQDVSIDWMSEAETIREQNQQASKQLRIVQYYPEQLRELRLPGVADEQLAQVPDVVQMYRFYKQGLLDMRLLMDYCYVLRSAAGRHETLKDGGLAGFLLGSVGLRRFARGLAWLLRESLALEPEFLLWKPLEAEGRYLMAELFRENSRMQRLSHTIKYLSL